MRGIIAALQRCSTLRQVQEVHALVLTSSPIPLEHHASALAHLLLSSTSLLIAQPQPGTSTTTVIAYALSLFHLAADPSIFLWNTIIRALTVSCLPRDAVSYFCRSHRAGVGPDSFTFAFSLKAAALLVDARLGEQVHAQVVKVAFESHAFVVSSLMRLYTKVGRMPFARKLFDGMPVRNEVGWCVMIAGYIEEGNVVEARSLFDRMPRRTAAAPWNALIEGYVRHGLPDEALWLFSSMVAATNAGTPPDRITILAALSACGQLGALELGRWLHSYAYKNAMFSNLSIRTALIDMYSKCGCTELAMQVFSGIEVRDRLSWTAIICGMAFNGHGEKALKLFSDMEESGTLPDDIAFIAVLSACSHAGLVNEGSKLFEIMIKKYGLTPKIEHYGCMVDILGRAGQLAEAYRFIMSMPVAANGTIWSALLGACRTHGDDGEIAKVATQNLVQAEPSRGDRYVLLSNVYAAKERWQDVERVRDLMKEARKHKKWGCSFMQVNA
ncbi:Pentatricopeptide repeat-containing protein [Nymphaea thermarum]|nr:Pentatricopeptide repeat-containing protein [Nymphaea thermarum]